MKDLGKVSMTPKGEYDATVGYERLDVVSYLGSGYLAKQASIGIVPTNTTYWMRIAQRGEVDWALLTEDQKEELSEELEGLCTGYGNRITAIESSKKYVTEAQYQALVDSGTVDPNVEYNVLEDE